MKNARKTLPSEMSALNNSLAGTRFWVGFILVAATALFVFWQFYDAPSYFTDDGIYGFFTQRALDAVLLGDHSYPFLKYNSIPNLLGMHVFGESLVSMRYPLVLVLIVLVVGTYCVLFRDGLTVALSGSAVMLALTLVQFMNPSASWYALATMLFAIVVLELGFKPNRWVYLLLGVLVGACFLVRQLNGVFLGAGIVMAVLPMLSAEMPSEQRLGVRCLMCTVFAVIAFISIRSVSIGSWVMYVLPLLLLSLLWFRDLRVANHVVWKFCAWFTVGICVAALPLIVVNAATGQLLSWAVGVFLSPLEFSWAAHFPGARLSSYPAFILEGAFRNPSFRSGVNAAFWLALVLIPAGLAWVLFGQSRTGQQACVRPVAIVASFAALGALHLQIPIYLFYFSPFCLIGLLAIFRRGTTARYAVQFGSLFLVVVGLVFHAGKAEPDNEGDLWRGERTKQVVKCPIVRSGLSMSARQCDDYTLVLELIDARKPDGGSILTIPNSAEINFLVDSPQDFHNCAMAIGSEALEEEYVSRYKEYPPDLLIVNRKDKYYSDRCSRLVERLLPNYSFVEKISQFEIYQRSSAKPFHPL